MIYIILEHMGAVDNVQRWGPSQGPMGAPSTIAVPHLISPLERVKWSTHFGPQCAHTLCHVDMCGGASPISLLCPLWPSRWLPS